ncbi:MAG: DotG/IcmE/VirB10 family protein [Pseudomonadota bacterium]
MSDNDDFDDDFDLDDFGDDEFGDLQSKNSLADLWKNNPIVKIAAVGGGLLVIAFIFMFLNDSSGDVAPSRVAQGSEVSELPGTTDLSPAMREAIQDENNRRLEEAKRNQISVMPLPVDPLKELPAMPIEEVDEEDPLERWRQMQQERLREQQVTNSVPQQNVQPVDTRTPAINALAESMSVQMQSILNNQTIARIQRSNVTPEDYLRRLEEEEQARLEAEIAAAQQVAQSLVTDDNVDSADILIPAGTIEYAQMLTEANTDAPGPILAQIASGPLRGARMIGSFSPTDNYLTLNFSTVVLDGVSYSISAVALDPETTLPGVATDINRRYLQRVVLPAAAAFIEGLADAIADSGTTTVTIEGETVTEESSDRTNEQEVSTGIAEAGAEIGEIFDEIADEAEPLIRVRAGTPIGIFFTAPVLDRPDLNTTDNQS